MKDLAIKLEEKNHQTEFEQEYRRFPEATDSPNTFHKMAVALLHQVDIETPHSVSWYARCKLQEEARIDIITQHTFGCSVGAIPPYWRLITDDEKARRKQNQWAA